MLRPPLQAARLHERLRGNGSADRFPNTTALGPPNPGVTLFIAVFWLLIAAPLLVTEL